MAEEKVRVVKGPGNRRGPIGPRPKLDNPFKTLSRLLKFMGKHYGVHMIVVLLCIFTSVFANVRGTWFTQALIDDYILPLVDVVKEGGTADYGPLLGAMVQVAIFYGIGILAAWVQAQIMVFVTQGTLKSLRDEMFMHMQNLPIKYFDTHSHGDIMSMYTNDIDTLRQMISQAMPQIINSIITIVSVFASMIALSVPLTFVSIFMIGVVLFVSKKLASLSSKYFVKQQKDIGAVNGYIEEMMAGQKVVKVFCHEDVAISEFKELNDSLCESSYNANKFSNVMGPCNAQLGNVSYILCACVGALIAINGFLGFTLTPGALVSYLTFNRQFAQPINQMTMQINSIIMAIAGAERIFKLLDEEPEVDDGYVTLVRAKKIDGEIVECKERTGLWAWKHYHKDSDTTTYTEMKGEIVLDGVDFGYTDEQIVLHDVKLYANAGQKIAFVGSTGAGKTTITNLINRFYDIQDGKIRYDGININKIKKADLRKSLGIVLQDTHLFTDTIMENIRYGNLEATDEEVIAAAKVANADAFIRRLPDGYNTVIKGDGGSLSQGQRQLLAIARATVADPPALILDEATSSIDTRTERLVQEGMDALMKGRTTFVIAHRLSTIRNSDCIMVLEKGRIIERGSHEELMEEKGTYYRLQTGSSAS